MKLSDLVYGIEGELGEGPALRDADHEVVVATDDGRRYIPESASMDADGTMILNVVRTNASDDQFADALDDFKRATAHLHWCWSHGDVPDTVFGDTYPHIPSFDEFAMEVAEMRQVKPLPRHDVPVVGQQVVTTTVVERYPWFAVPEGWLGTISEVGDHDGDDRIEVRMDRYVGPGGHEHNNCVVISSQDVYTSDGIGPDDGISSLEAAAIYFHRNFKVIP